MTFILVFVLEISSRLAMASEELAGNAGGADAPDRLTSSAGVSVPDVGDLAGGLDIFGTQDTTLTSVVIITVITILTVANSVAPKFATGGSNLKIASYGSMMCIVSGVILGIVPILTGKLFPVG